MRLVIRHVNDNRPVAAIKGRVHKQNRDMTLSYKNAETRVELWGSQKWPAFVRLKVKAKVFMRNVGGISLNGTCFPEEVRHESRIASIGPDVRRKPGSRSPVQNADIGAVLSADDRASRRQ